MGSVAIVYTARPFLSRLLVVCEAGGVHPGDQGPAQDLQEQPLPQSCCFPYQGKREEVGRGKHLLPTKERRKAWQISTALVVQD